MSSVSIQGNASGTGIFTIASPNSNTNRTLTLPDATGTVLTSATTTGFPAGSVLQVVQGTKTTGSSTTSTTFVDTGLSASITPSSASSKVLVIVAQSYSHYQNTNTARDFYTNLLRGSTQIYIKYSASAGGTASNGYFYACLDGSMVYLDSPATTSSTTYKTQYKTSSGANDTNIFISSDNSSSSIVLMEIAFARTVLILETSL